MSYTLGCMRFLEYMGFVLAVFPLKYGFIIVQITLYVPGECSLFFLSSPHSPPFSNSGCVKRKINERLQYLGRQFLSEMGLSQWKSLDFWSMVVIFILCWWIRLYLHYVAQYGFLRISNIPVIRSVSVMYTIIVGP